MIDFFDIDDGGAGRYARNITEHLLALGVSHTTMPPEPGSHSHSPEDVWIFHKHLMVSKDTDIALRSFLAQAG